MTIPGGYPRKFSKYVLVAPLARGGMGQLHLAVSGKADLRKLCVIKQIIGHLATSEYVRRFADETALMVKLSHGNLVPVFEGGIQDGQYFLAMEFIEGKNLRTVSGLLSEERRCPLEVALHVTKEICRGLHYAHTYSDLKLVHRDVSPPNVLLSYSGEVKLTDFGLAFSTMKLQKTAPGVLFGKLSYMAPEQARNEQIDARVDIFSTGVILWELLTGKRLFPPEGSQLDQVTRLVNPQIPPPSAVGPHLPAALDRVALRALAVDREERYATAEEMRIDLVEELARIAPTTDAGAVQHWLRDLFGEKIEEERAARERMLESMAQQIEALIDDSGESVSLSIPLEGTAPRPASQGVDAPMPGLPPGTVVGERYRIDRKLREGGMGTVYAATHTAIEKQVAVKVLHPMYSGIPYVVSRFRREAKAASRIGHPNIVEVFDSGTTEGGSIYFVMEQLEGQDLADVVTELKRLEIDRALHIAIQICHAIAAAHEAGIVHRDLKPENIFLTIREGDTDFVKVLDFGIAQMAQDSSAQEQLTIPGTPLGTPEYMAPEQAAGAACDHRVDIYAVGALLYEMLLGHTMHDGETMLEILAQKSAPEVALLRTERQEVPPELERLVQWTLRRDPADRPQTANQLLYELIKLRSGRAGAVASMLGIAEDAPRVASSAVQPEMEGPAVPKTLEVPPLDPPPPGVSYRWWLPVAVAVAASAVLAVVLLSRTETPAQRVSALVTVDGGGGLATPMSRSVTAAGGDGGVARASDLSGFTGKHLARRIGARILVEKGQRHLEGGRFTEARQAFEAAQRSSKARADALTGLAELEFQQGGFKAARTYATEAVDAGGGLRAELILGNTYFKLGNYRRAIAMYRKVLERDRGHQEARRNLEAAREKVRATQGASR